MSILNEAHARKVAEAILEAMGGIVPDELESMHMDAARAAVSIVAPNAWLEGHAAGRDYQGDGWNADAHDPELDSPYRGDAS